jgi:tripartite-type tricarboxylate transporter receptor subunit TctC
MLIPHSFVWTVSAAVMICSANVTSAQSFPTKPIRLVTGAAGGGGDFLSRLVAPGFSNAMGQPVIVDARPGNVGPELVAKAQPDGYTLLIDSTTFLIAPLLQKMPYEGLRDFSAISLMVSSLNILVVHPSVSANSVKELIALFKASPGKFNYGSGSASSSSLLATELFKSMTGVDIVRIPYKGGGPTMTALVAGEVQMVIASAGSSTPHIKSGRVRPLAVTSAQRSPLFPDLPTIAATVPGYESVSMTGMFAPAGAPAAIVNRLSRDIARVINAPELREKSLAAGLETVGGTPQEFAAAVKADLTRLGKVIKDAGIKGE